MDLTLLEMMITSLPNLVGLSVLSYVLYSLLTRTIDMLRDELNQCREVTDRMLSVLNTEQEKEN